MQPKPAARLAKAAKNAPAIAMVVSVDRARTVVTVPTAVVMSQATVMMQCPNKVQHQSLFRHRP